MSELVLRPLPRWISAPLAGALCGAIAYKFPQVGAGSRGRTYTASHHSTFHCMPHTVPTKCSTPPPPHTTHHTTPHHTHHIHHIGTYTTPHTQHNTTRTTYTTPHTTTHPPHPPHTPHRTPHHTTPHHTIPHYTHHITPHTPHHTTPPTYTTPHTTPHPPHPPLTNTTARSAALHSMARMCASLEPYCYCQDLWLGEGAVVVGRATRGQHVGCGRVCCV